MGCQSCQDCDGEVEDTAKSLDFNTGFASSDCEVDGNGIYSQTLCIDSNRPTDAKLRITVDPDNELQVVSPNPVKETIQAYESGVTVNFDIEKASNGSRAQPKINLCVEFRRRDSHPWRNLIILKPRRKLAVGP